MNKIIKILFVFCFLGCVTSFAQDPPPPPGGGHGQGGNQTPGGSAPVDNGILIVALLGTAYGLRKWYKYRKEMTPA